MRSAAACAPSAVLRRRSVMEGGPCPLLARAPASGSPCQVVLNKAGSAVPLVPPRKAHVLVRGLCGSAEAVLGMQGLAVRLVQGQRLVPL